MLTALQTVSADKPFCSNEQQAGLALQKAKTPRGAINPTRRKKFREDSRKIVRAINTFLRPLDSSLISLHFPDSIFRVPEIISSI